MTLTPFSEFHEAATCFAAATLNALSELTSRRNESCTVAASVTIVSVTAVSVEPEPSVESVESPESVFSLSKSTTFPSETVESVRFFGVRTVRKSTL